MWRLPGAKLRIDQGATEFRSEAQKRFLVGPRRAGLSSCLVTGGEMRSGKLVADALCLRCTLVPEVSEKEQPC